nr:DegT/DnrJ/EryC1/StrS family aminotransferase [Microbacterium thalassium]
MCAVGERHRSATDRAIARVLDSGRLILGPESEAFEREFAAACGVRHAIGVGNGLDALTLILKASGIGPGDEVLVPANTFIATALAVTATGATPVWVEPDPVTYTIDVAAAQRSIGPRTRAIIAVHLFGLLCDMDALQELADRHGLILVEDAAQAHGARRDARAAGAFGHAAGFSFYPTKNLGAIGDAGAVTTDDDELADRVRMLRNYGSRRKSVHEVAGVNSRLDELQAAVLREKLPALEGENRRRRAIADHYRRELAQSRVLLPAPAGDDHVHHLFVIRVADRPSVVAALAERGVGTAVHYPTPVHRHPAYADSGAPALPVAETLADEILSIPMHPALSDAEVEHVAEAVRAVA